MPRYIREKLTDKEKAMLEDSFNGLVFQNQDAKHPHPVLHYSRKFLEQEAIDKLNDLGVASVLDIGGNAARAGKYAAKKGLIYHSTNPITDTSDAIRGKLHEMQHGAAVSYCRHRVEQCLCMPIHDALLSVHSLYYFEPETLVQLIARTQRKILIAVVHLFEGYSGNFPVGTRESTWELVGRNVNMRAAGNPHVYNHSALLWLHGGGVSTPSGNLAWTFIKEACGNTLIVFTTTLAPVPRSTLSDLRPGTRLDQRDLRGLRNVQATVDYQYREMEVKDVIVARFGLIIDTELNRTVIIPNELLSEAKLWVVGKERSQANWGLLVNNLRGKVGKLNVHHSMTSEIVLICAALAFTETVHSELQALVMLSRYQSQFGILKQWTAIPVMGWQTIVIGLASILGASVLVMSRRNPPAMPSLSMTPFGHNGFIGIRAVSGSFNWRSALWVAGVIGVSVLGYFGITKYVTVKSFTSTVPSLYSTKPDLELLYEKPKVGTIVSMPDLYEKKEKAGYTPVVTVNNIVPVRCANDNATTVHALVARMLKGVEQADWGHIIAKEDKWDKWFGPKTHLEVLPFESWIVDQYNRSKDKPRVAQLQKAYMELMADPTLLKFEIQPFVKNEAYVGKGANPKPRMILATNDYYLVATGPLCSALSADLKRRWNKNHFVYYTSGANARDLGEWFARGCAKFPDGVIVWADMKEYEARIAVQAVQTEVRIDRHITDMSQDQGDLLLMQINQVGKTRTGLRWFRKAGRVSGVGNTSDGNSKDNGVVSLELYDRYDLPLEDHIMMGVLGDDNLCFLSAQMWEALGKTVEPIEAAYKQVGWSPVADWCRVRDYHKAEFCSGWFPRIIEEGHADQIMHTWSPKVGRVLAKTFQLKPTEQNGPGVVRGIAIGLSCGPVDPLLWTFCNSLNQTLKEVQPVMWIQSEYNPLITKRPGVTVDPVSTMERYGLSREQYDRVVTYLRFKAEACEWPINLSSYECPEWDLIDRKDIEYDDFFDEVSTNDDEAQKKPNTTAMDRNPIERVPDLHKHPKQTKDGTPIVNQPKPKGRPPKPGKRERRFVEQIKGSQDKKHDPDNNNRPVDQPREEEKPQQEQPRTRERPDRERGRANRGGSRRGADRDRGAVYRPRRGSRGGASAALGFFDLNTALDFLREGAALLGRLMFSRVNESALALLWDGLATVRKGIIAAGIAMGMPSIVDIMLTYKMWWVEATMTWTPFYYCSIVGEELIKGTSVNRSVWFALGELVFTKSPLFLTGFLPPRALVLTVPAVVMHILNAHGPLWKRVLRHLAFNAAIQLVVGPLMWWWLDLPTPPANMDHPVTVPVVEMP